MTSCSSQHCPVMQANTGSTYSPTSDVISVASCGAAALLGAAAGRGRCRAIGCFVDISEGPLCPEDKGTKMFRCFETPESTRCFETPESTRRFEASRLKTPGSFVNRIEDTDSRLHSNEDSGLLGLLTVNSRIIDSRRFERSCRCLQGLRSTGGLDP